MTPEDISLDSAQKPVMDPENNKSSATEKICPLCYNLDLQHIDYEVVYDASSTSSRTVGPRKIALLSVKESGEHGCISCKLLYRACTSVGIKIITEASWCFQFLRCIEESYQPLVIVLDYVSPPNGRPAPVISGQNHFWIKVYIPQRGPESAWRSIPYSREPLGHRSDGYEHVLLEWIKDCDENHDKCRKKSTALPTRVLDVSSSGEDEVKLHISNGEVEPYLALSYCWGTTTFIQTTKETISQRKQGIPMSSLPSTLRDAVMVTRALQVKYLWIDALCIIQDDSLDWTREAGRMATIYKNAYVVLSAVVADNVTDGFLDVKQSGAESVNITKLISTPETLPPIHARLYDQHRDLASYLDDSLAGAKKQIRTRAWVLQEKLLASRTIYFTETELSWECASGLKCECMEIDNDPQYTKWDITTNLESSRKKQGVYKDWAEILKYFMARDLTYETDRLPALSGIVKEMQAHGAGPYFAGLWERTLYQDLLWMTYTDATRLRRADPYRGPTWSWISSDTTQTGPPQSKPKITESVLIYVKQKLDHISAKVLQIHCEAAGDDPTGAVQSAYLTLEAPILDFIIIDKNTQKFGEEVLHYKSRDNHTLAICWDIEPRPKVVLSCVLIGETNTEDGITPHGIILQSVLGEKVYERVGMLQDVCLLKVPLVKVPDPRPKAWELLLAAPRRVVTII